MKFIYYNVSGGDMDLLQLITSLFGGNVDFSAFLPLINMLKSGNFDFNSILTLLQNEKILPIIKNFFNSFNNKSPTETVGQISGLSPIASIADKDIVFVLNRYLSCP
jgi:hypothetical protein